MTDYFLRDREELARLKAIEHFLDPGTIRVFEAIGIHDGWHCLEVGAGGGSIAAWLAQRVRDNGHVVATDLDTRFLDNAGASNLEVWRHDITSDALPFGVYDLIHTRVVLEHLPAATRARALESMVTALKPGGWLIAECSDFISWTAATECSPERSEFFTRASAAVFRFLPLDFFYGRYLAEAIAALGLIDVAADGRMPVVRGGSMTSQIWRIAWASLRERIITSDVLSEREFNDFIALHDDPSFRWLGPTVVAVWGRWPSQ